jgi:2-hydroxy-3-oxopropionate reductase
MTERIALIGAGIMGSAIGTRLLECGHHLSVFDLDADKVAALVKRGATAATSPADATSRSDFIILSLNRAHCTCCCVWQRWYC